MPRLTWSRQAIADPEKVRGRLRERSPDAARRTVARVIEAAARLTAFPGLGKAGPEPGVRTLVVARSRFLLDYRVEEDVVEILAVTDGTPRR